MANRDIGFSMATGQAVLYDQDLVAQDLLNHLYTRKGERLGDPEYGSIIWDKLFELNTDVVREQIEQDILRIIATEPRVRMIDYILEYKDNSVTMRVELMYIPTQTPLTLQANFDQQLAQD